MKTKIHGPRKKEKHAVKNKKTRRFHKKISLNLEYRKLRSLLPRTSKKPKLQKKVNVVDAAYRYIRQLQTALLDKFSSRGIPPDLAGVVGNKVTSDKDVQALALHLIKQNSCNASTTHSIPPSNINNNDASSVNQNFPTTSIYDSERVIKLEGISQDGKEQLIRDSNGIGIKTPSKVESDSWTKIPPYTDLSL